MTTTEFHMDQTVVKHLSQGDYEVSHDPNVMFSTTLGSCVSVCMWDSVLKFGGMNHMLLPDHQKNKTNWEINDVHAMELLVNALIKKGATKRNLQAKVFGGARMVKGLSEIGMQNGVFAMKFLTQENIPCLAESLGGDRARRLQFWPTTGRVRQRFVKSADPIVASAAPKPMAAGGDLELF
ncbi:chemotaxis protein CheD [Parasulfitobacter algicola]|uniref:Probable chemoreceptor glutamine deamidase CheD n=1 Tax=Parasulfitobacter algicola TaxID=2614809 RepID=A0ABX2J012_9RHOB|nr:chemotaxis protein CheD [Sulfitobacter algicola]NSX56338.1 chemotaxis protein CheD [Sulfitobacter algicola]